MHTLNEPHVILCRQTKEDQPVEVETQKVLGPEVKEFHQCYPKFVEFLMRRRPRVDTATRITKTRGWEKGSDHNIWVKTEDQFHKSTNQV